MTLRFDTLKHALDHGIPPEAVKPAFDAARKKHRQARKKGPKTGDRLSREQYQVFLDSKLSEAQFQAQIVTMARWHGWKVYHTYDSRRSEPGFPDLIMLRSGVQVVIECKSLNGKVTDDQQGWLDAFRAVPQCIVRVWRPSDWAEIHEVLQNASLR